MRKSTLALLLAAGAAAPVLTACGGGGGPEATLVAEIEVDPPVGPDIKIADDGSLWLPASDSFQGRPPDEPRHAVVRIDPERNEVSAVVDVAHQMSAVAVGEDAVWAVGTDFGPEAEQPVGSLVRIDPGTAEATATVGFGERSSPSDVAVGFGAVWVSDSTGDRVIRVNPDTGEIVAEIAVDGGPTSLTITDDAVWVTKPRTGEVRGIDPATNRPLPAVGTGPNPAILEAGGAGLWVADYADDTLSRIDTEAGAVADTVEFPTAPSRFDVGERTIAVVESEGRALSIVRDGDRDEVLVGRLLVAVALSADEQTVWVVDAGDRLVVRLSLPAG